MSFYRHRLRMLLIFFYILPLVAVSDDLYNVLGVKKSASQREVRQAYKNMAKEWHPDKNKDPDAADKFTKINEAYETLGDEERRREYDNFGYTAARDQNRQDHAGFSPFDSFFKSSGFNFKFNFGGNFNAESIIDKFTITQRSYDTKLFPDSYKKPCIIYIYSDFCFDCMRIEHFIEKFIKELNGVGICVGTFHAGVSRGLATHLRINHVPTILGISAGRVTHFKGGVNTQTLREFARNLFPSKTVLKITDASYSDFLDGWMDNKVRALFFSTKEEPSARFLASAFYYKDNIAFGYVNTRSADADKLLHRFNLNKNRESLLMFNEETSSPVATLSMQQLPRSTLDEVLEANKFLQLPRLSSQKFFDDLCTEESKVKKRKLCVVLFTKKEADHGEYRDSFRKYTQTKTVPQIDRVKFAYIFEETQKGFLEALAKGGSTKQQENDLKVAILWRYEKSRLSYEWLQTGWSLDKERERLCADTLNERLHLLLTTEHILPFKATLPELYNEHSLALLVRIFYRLWDWCDRVTLFIASYDGTTWMSILLSLLFVMGMGYFMVRMASIEEEQVRRKIPRKTKPRPPSSTVDQKTLHLYELRNESYDDLVKEADTGLTILVLVDEDTKDKLIHKFAKIMHPYSRYSALTFAFVQLEYYIGWYRHLLEESLDFQVSLPNINIRNCVGTGLAINGYRKYFYIYHAKRARKWMRQTNKVSQAMGFTETDEEESENEGDNVFFVEELLDGMSLWMDRIFDGSAKKIRVSYWPEMTVT